MQQPPGFYLETSDERENALKRRAVIELQRVPGIGCVYRPSHTRVVLNFSRRAVKAKALAEAGCLSLLDLLSKTEFLDKLSVLQWTNLKYMDHLPIPSTPEQVEQALVSVLGLPPRPTNSRSPAFPRLTPIHPSIHSLNHSSRTYVKPICRQSMNS